MQFRPETWRWQSLLWWLSVLAVVVSLKQHYSIATAADLEWMLRPLSLLLEWFTGHDFHRDSNFEWVSEGADVRLVKSCAGINFMLMSFMTYAWITRPDTRVDTDHLSLIMGQLLILCAAMVASWATSLIANSLRIILAMAAADQGWELDLIGIDAVELHRLIGMLIYVPLLSLQMMLGRRASIRDAFLAPVLLYLLLMVLVPIVTGNALRHPVLFMEHLVYVSIMVAVMCSIVFLYHYRLPISRYRKAHLGY